MMKACLEDSGWFDVEFLDDGGIKVHVAPDGASKEEIAQRQVAYQKDFQACLKQTGFDQPRQVDPKEEYRQQTEVDECLRQYGIPIKSPTFEQFQQGEYSERLSLLPKDPTKLKSLQQECHF